MNKEIKEIREMLDFFSQPMMFEKRKNIYNNEFVNFEKNGELLREGLIKSYGADYVVSNLKKVFDLTSKFENYKKNYSKGTNSYPTFECEIILSLPSKMRSLRI